MGGGGGGVWRVYFVDILNVMFLWNYWLFPGSITQAVVNIYRTESNDSCDQ